MSAPRQTPTQPRASEAPRLLTTPTVRFVQSLLGLAGSPGGVDRGGGGTTPHTGSHPSSGTTLVASEGGLSPPSVTAELERSSKHMHSHSLTHVHSVDHLRPFSRTRPASPSCMCVGMGMRSNARCQQPAVRLARLSPGAATDSEWMRRIDRARRRRRGGGGSIEEPGRRRAARMMTTVGGERTGLPHADRHAHIMHEPKAVTTRGEVGERIVPHSSYCSSD